MADPLQFVTLYRCNQTGPWCLTEEDALSRRAHYPKVLEACRAVKLPDGHYYKIEPESDRLNVWEPANG